MTGRLADQQAALVRALVAGGPAPAGFDPGRVAATELALRHKRAREVAVHWPRLMSDGATHARFLEWARARPKSSSFADGLAFAEHLECDGVLPPVAVAELAAVRSARSTRRAWRRSR